MNKKELTDNLKNMSVKPRISWGIKTQYDIFVEKLVLDIISPAIENIKGSIYRIYESFKFNNLYNMKKKLIAGILTLVLAFTAIATPVAASSEGVGPGDLLYPIDLLLEDIRLAFAGGDEEKAEMLMEILEERIAEIEALSEEADDGEEFPDSDGDSDEDSTSEDDVTTEENEELIEELSEAQTLYEETLAQLQETIEDLCPEGAEDCDEEAIGKALHVGEMTLKHVEVLARVYDAQVEKGNEGASEAILGAMESSLNGHKHAVANAVDRVEVLEEESADEAPDSDTDSNEEDFEGLEAYAEEAEELEADDFVDTDAFSSDEDEDDDKLTKEERQEAKEAKAAEREQRREEMGKKFKEKKEKAEKKVKRLKSRGGSGR